MIYTIYLVFVDAAVFIWKYPYILITSYLYLLTSWLLETTVIGNSAYEICLRDLFLFLLSLVNIVFVSVIINLKEVLSDKRIIFRKLLINAIERALMLSACLLLVIMFYDFLEMLLLLIVNAIVMEFVSNIIYWNLAVAYLFGIMHQVFYKNNLIFVPATEGLKGFYKNFVFYLLVYLASILIIRFPSLLFPASWIALPIIPLAESIGIRPIGWTSAFWLLLCPILSTLQLVAINFAFLYKNRNKLPQS